MRVFPPFGGAGFCLLAGYVLHRRVPVIVATLRLQVDPVTVLGTTRPSITAGGSDGEAVTRSSVTHADLQKGMWPHLSVTCMAR